MATTPGRPRTSGIPTPGRSAIPTPGRLRSSSSASTVGHSNPSPPDMSTMDQAFAAAMKSNNPARHHAPNSPPHRRPPSAASNLRPKTPSSIAAGSVSRRPSSRQSDVFVRSQRPFEVGDNVRIESLGFEGTLQYLGEIEGKQGLWAGVELSGGFAGKGKNNGSVDGKQYFRCPPKCGVFVASTKLSPPTVGPGAISRPSSVASRVSMSGRITPSLGQSFTPYASGRIPPSLSNGRITPSRSGPLSASSSGFSTPASRKNSRAISAANTPSAAAMSKFTAGSRASKYVGMTAKQLANRNGSAPVPAIRQSLGQGSPSRSPAIGSPTRSLAVGDTTLTTPRPTSRISGVGTPKSIGQGRPSLAATPKARIPSAVAMPPPPSPSGTSRSVSLNDKPITPTFSSASNDTAVDDDVPHSLNAIQQNQKSLQDKIAQLLSGKTTPVHDAVLPQEADDDSPAQVRPIEMLTKRLEALEEDNRSLRSQLEKGDSTETSAKIETLQQEKDAQASKLSTLQQERDLHLSKASTLEAQVKMLERSMKEKETKVESLERAAQASSDKLEQATAEADARAKDLQGKLNDSENLIASLKEAMEAKATEAGQNEGIIQAKNTEISLLEARAKKAEAEIDDTKTKLNEKLEILRLAGQEAIALYESRLNTADQQRYDFEEKIALLEQQLREKERAMSPESLARQASTAAQIDNEALREEERHLKKKIATLEDLLEDARANAENIEGAYRAKVMRYKENEAAMKKEVVDVRKEVERAVKSEAMARGRVEETEEALRESTMALENARAEIEGLRADLAALEGLQAGGEKASKGDELHALKTQLATAKAEISSLVNVQRRLESSDSEKAELEQINHELETSLENERIVVSELRRVLDEKSSELESTRKSLNRDRPLNVTPDHASTSSIKQDLSTAREEIKGLKHIIQDLQNEISGLSTKNKHLDSENKILVSETEQLRHEMTLLEEGVEQSILREEQSLESVMGAPLSDGDGAEVQAKYTRQVEQLKREMDQMRKTHAEEQAKKDREINDHEKELAELEALVEHKIYREDDLEREVARLKSDLERAKAKASRSPKKSSKPSIDTAPPDRRTSASPSSSADTSLELQTPTDQDLCEICEGKGHDIMTCPVFNGDTTVSSTRSSRPSELFCVDCDEFGHTTADCPHSLDVF